MPVMGTPAVPRSTEDRQAAISELLATSRIPAVQRYGLMQQGTLDTTMAREDMQKERQLERQQAAELKRELQASQLAEREREAKGRLELQGQIADLTAKTAMRRQDLTMQPITVIDENGKAVVKDARTNKVLGTAPSDPKLQGVFNQDTNALNSTIADLDRLAVKANEIETHKGLKGITGIRGAFPNVPGSDAADAEAKLNTLKSQIAFSVLQTMRNNSKTGGALGNVSDAEGKRLEANLEALDKAQSIEQFKEAMVGIKKYVTEAKDRMYDAYNMKHGEKVAKMEGATPGKQAGKRLKFDAQGNPMP